MSIEFYVSGNYNNAADNMLVDYLLDIKSPILSSYAYKGVLYPRAQTFAEKLRERKQRLKHMIDSGAFTSWSSGKVINLDEYCDACNQLLDDYGDCMDLVFVALDEIPGKKGRETTQADRDTACTISAKNYDVMRERVRGVVKPVFHTGDPDWLLKHYAESDYISFGMSQALSEVERVAWVVNSRHKAKGKKLHGLAATGFSMLRAARWHSVDSAAWQYCASMGGMNWVKQDGRLIALAISNESPKQKDFDGHYNTLSFCHQEVIRAAVEKAGLTIEELQSQYVARWRWNIACYHEACRRASDAPLINLEKGLFDA